MLILIKYFVKYSCSLVADPGRLTEAISQIASLAFRLTYEFREKVISTNISSGPETMVVITGRDFQFFGFGVRQAAAIQSAMVNIAYGNGLLGIFCKL